MTGAGSCAFLDVCVVCILLMPLDGLRGRLIALMHFPAVGASATALAAVTHGLAAVSEGAAHGE